MIKISLPGRDMDLEISHLLLDLNGTLTLDGDLIDGVMPRIELLKEKLRVILLTSDTRGRGAQVAEELGVTYYKVGSGSGGPDKLDYLNTIGPEETMAIGNGYNDRLMLKAAALSIAVIGGEGACFEAIRNADIAVNNIIDALDLIIDPVRLIATLRD